MGWSCFGWKPPAAVCITTTSTSAETERGGCSTATLVSPYLCVWNFKNILHSHRATLLIKQRRKRIGKPAFFIQSQTVITLGFAGHIISTAAIQLRVWYCSSKVEKTKLIKMALIQQNIKVHLICNLKYDAPFFSRHQKKCMKHSYFSGYIKTSKKSLWDGTAQPDNLQIELNL